MSMLLTVIVPVFAVIVIGRLAVLRGFTDASTVRGMSDLVFYVAMPCLLFDAIVRAEELRLADSTALFLGISLVIYAVGMALGGALFGLSFAKAAVTGLNAAFGNAVLISGMPPGANAFLLARRTETAMEASAATVVLATVLSVFNLSVLLAVLQSF